MRELSASERRIQPEQPALGNVFRLEIGGLRPDLFHVVPLSSRVGLIGHHTKSNETWLDLVGWAAST